MKEGFGKKLAWLFVGACTAANALLAWKVVEFHDLSGAGAAQAELGLFFVASGTSALFALFLGGAVVVTYFAKDRRKGLTGIFRYNNGICGVAFLNSSVPVFIYYWLLTV